MSCVYVHVHVYFSCISSVYMWHCIDMTLFVYTGATKVLTCAENWIAAGSTSGTVNSLDLRNGEFLCTWRPSEFPSAQVHGQNSPLYIHVHAYMHVIYIHTYIHAYIHIIHTYMYICTMYIHTCVATRVDKRLLTKNT